MKKTTLLLLFLCAITQAQNVNIPDANFKNALLNHSPKIDTNNDGEISIAEAESFTENMNIGSKNISNLKGIEYFVNLTSLHCTYNQISSIDVSKNTKLTFLNCESNNIASLDVTNNVNLSFLDIQRNQISSIDVSKNIVLEGFNCSFNPITTLDLTNNLDLEMLHCGFTNVQTLDISNNIFLNELLSQYTQLSSLDISENINLKGLYVSNNRLTSLDISNNKELVVLNCSNNLISNLDFNNHTKLVRIFCNNNLIEDLELQTSSFVNLNAQNNRLKSINIKNGTNDTIDTLNLAFNPNLNCLEIDDQTISSSWQKKQDIWYTEYETNITFYKFDWDDHIVFSEDCSALSNQDITNTTFKVYPNPAKNFITIDSTLEGNYNLVSILGKTVTKGTLRQGDNTIDLSNFNKGIYLLNISSDSYSKTIKIVKE